MQQADAAQAKRYLKIQAILGALSVAAALPFGGPIALSALIGAGACLIANALFAASVFRGYRAQEPERLLLRIYGAEAVKVATILGVFALSFATVDGLNLPVLLGAYLVTQVAAPIIAAQSEGRRASGQPVPPTTASRSER
jgi:ATP synthase protein I